MQEKKQTGEQNQVLAGRNPVLEALRSVTTWGARQFHEERLKGSLEPGKLADMTILAENPLAVAPRRLRDISVVGVLVGNELMFGEC